MNKKICGGMGVEGVKKGGLGMDPLGMRLDGLLGAGLRGFFLSGC